MAKGLDERIAEFTVFRVHGKDLAHTMGQLLFKDALTDISEFCANAYDADAKHLEITYKPEEDLLSISDNGEGMDKEVGIPAFFRLGDSTKRAQPVSPNGRRRVGSFGVATVSLTALTTNYILQTSKGGVQYTVEETFKPGEDDSKPIPVQSKRISSDIHGTTITMKGLKFLKDGREFTAEDLKKRLAIEMPLSGEFTINVNGQAVVPMALENAVEYSLDLEEPLVGEIKGSIFYNRKSIGDNGGIYFKVDGRAIGGSNFEIFGEKFGPLSRRLFGVVHADGLRELIGLDRKSFLSDHPKFKAVTNQLFNVLKQIRQDVEMEVANRSKTKTDGRLEKIILPAVGRAVRDIVDDGGEAYTLFFNPKEAGSIARIDTQKRELYLNPRSPALSLSKVSPVEVKKTLLNAAVYALTYNTLPELDKKGIKLDLRDKFEELSLRLAKYTSGTNKTSIAELLGMTPVEEVKENFYRISPNRLYYYNEVTKATAWDNALIKRMVDSGVLDNKSNERILGADIGSVQEKLGGRLSIFEAIRKAFPDPDTNQSKSVWWAGSENRVVGDLDALVEGYAPKAGTVGGRRAKLKEEVKIPPYVTNLATNGKPSFWVVDETHLDLFRHFALTGELRDAGTLSKPLYTYHRFKRQGGVIVYALEVQGEMAPDAVRSLLKEKFKFVEDKEEGGLPLGINTRSTCSTYLGKNYIVGVYAGDDISVIDEMPDKFIAGGFKNVKVPSTALQYLFSEVSGQRTRSMPVVISHELNSNYVTVLAPMLGIEIEKPKRVVDVKGEDPEEDLEDKVDEEDVPEESKGFFSGKTFTYSSIGSNNGVLAYLLEVKDPANLRGIKDRIEETIDFVEGVEDVKSSSYLSKYGGKTYVLGFYVGNVAGLQEEFTTSEFHKIPYRENSTPFAILTLAKQQKALGLPLRKLDAFDSNMKKYVAALALRKA